MSLHVLLSPSAAERWINCPPSARLAQNYPDPMSTYAQEGTAAHELAEAMLGAALEREGYECYWSHTQHVPPNEYHCAAMNDFVQDYVDDVVQRVRQAQNPTIMLEQPLDYSEYVPRGRGIADTVLLADDRIEIVDFKYGQNIRVDAPNNPQILLYALGAYLNYGQLYAAQTVRVTIIQPRMGHTSSIDIPIADLFAWAENTATPAAWLAWLGQGEYNPGTWCRFCRAAGDCAARANANITFAEEAFAPDPATITDEKAADILTKLPAWESWVKAFKERTLERAVSGESTYPGYKLVQGQSKRRYTDLSAVTTALVEAGYPIDEISPREPLGVTAMTRVLGRKQFDALLGGLIYKPDGKPTLVPASDKRPEYSPPAAAQQAFAAYIENDKGD